MRIVSLIVLMFAFWKSFASAQWQIQPIPSQAHLRGLSVVTAKIAWISGTQGTFGRTIDGGETWKLGTVPETEGLDFRDVEAFGESTAYVFSIGPNENSRIYKTTDGGHSWVLQFKNTDPHAFFDALAFWDDRNGVALSDPVNQHFQLIITDDGGATWKRLAAKSLPPALPKESAFAASGTCLVTQGERDIWFCTGGAAKARLFHSADRGQHWTVIETPIPAASESAGIFSIAFRDRNHGLIVGGDYRQPNDVGATAARTVDGGQTWTLIERPFPFRSCVAWSSDRWIAVGTSGSDFSQDDGASWKALDQQNYNSAAFASTGTGWAVGPNGQVVKFIR